MKISVKNLQRKLAINPGKIRKSILKTLSLKAKNISGEINICFVGDAQIRKLNLKYLRHNNPTDVISFDMSLDKKNLLADIAVSSDTAIRNAGVFKTSPNYELYLYVVHGVLHLIGFNDHNAPGRKLMDKRAHAILKELNIK